MIRLLILSLLVPSLFAQLRTGSVYGIVTDATGAPMRAAVRVEHAATELAREAASDTAGTYRFELLPAGAYTVTASRDGFQTVVRAPIVVRVGEQARADFRLELSVRQDSVTIYGDAPQVNASTATSGVTIEARQIAQLPLNGRNFTRLGSLMPGVVEMPQRLLTPLSGTQAFSVGGQRTQSNNFLLDGVSNNDSLNSGYVLLPPPDALHEFRILTHQFSAEFGSNSGSVVNAITRAGGNQVHGAAWEYLRNDRLDARNFFAGGRPPLRQNQFGGMLSGPLRRDRTFLFGYYEGLRLREGLVQNVVTFSDAERQGDFRLSPQRPRDPLTGQPFAGDLVPPDRLDPVARAMLERLVPHGNAPGNRFKREVSRATDSDQFGLRGDHHLSAANSLFLRYSFSRGGSHNPLGAGSFSPAGSGSQLAAHGVVLSNTHAFSPNALNEASVAFLRHYSQPATWSGLPPDEYGFRYGGTEPGALGTPFVTLSGLFTLGDVQQAFTQIARNTYQFNDNFVWIRGRHALKFGGDVRRSQIFLVFPNRPNGDFTFTGGATGNTFADFLLGRPAQFRQGGGDPSKHFFATLPAAYAQDDVRLTRKLTLNIGVRYEPGMPFYDKYNRMASFQPGRISSVMPDAPANLLFPGDAGVPRATIRADRNNLAPRLGLAYDVFGDGSTSLRAGYGIFFDTIPGIAAFQNINVPPFNRFVQIDSVPEFADPYRNLPVNPHADPAGRFPCPCLVIGFSPDAVSPYVQHFNFGLGRQVARNLLLDLGYIGSTGTKFPGYMEVNPAVPGPGATRANTQARRIYEDYSLVRPTFSRFNSNYHSLQMRLERRFSSGLAFLTSYTWSKAIDQQSSVNLGDARPQDAFSLSDVRGLAIFDTRHRLVFSYSYELPWLKNTRSWAGLVLGGWRLDGILSAQSGNPLTATEPVDRSLRGLNADRPDQALNPNRGPGTPSQWFLTDAFVRLPDAPGGQRSGTAGRNTITGPGLVESDLAASKNFRLREGQKLEIRSEVFNALNRANFHNPGSNIGAPQTFGVIQSARPARIVQVAAKYHF